MITGPASVPADYRDRYAGRRCLITGGLGFIGSNLAHRLVELGADVLIVDSLHPECGGNWFNIAGIEERVRVETTDLRSEPDVSRLVRGQEVIFNLAGQTSHVDSMRDPNRDLENNCRAQITLLEACRRHNPEAVLVYTSTRQVYGRAAALPVSEAHPVRPVDINGVHKRTGEMYHQLFHDCYGLRSVSLRLTNTYGPRMQMQHNRQGFIAWFVRLAIEGECISLFGTGEQQRDMNEVSDVVEALLRAAATESCYGQVMNLGHARPISLRALIEILIEVCPGCSYQLAPFPQEKQRIDIGDFCSDYSRFHQATGWAPQVDPEPGLRRMVDYYLRHRNHYW